MEKVKFNVSSKTARLIGRENISDSNGAIIELIKNAYDADAENAYLQFDIKYGDVPEFIEEIKYETEFSKDEKKYINLFYEKSDNRLIRKKDISEDDIDNLKRIFFSHNEIILVDNGIGMSEEIIKNVWMNIGTDDKEINVYSNKGRIKTGAKGIGRFALEKLALETTVFTQRKNEKLVYWNMDWTQFDNSKLLNEIDANVECLDVSFNDKLKDVLNENYKNISGENWEHGTIIILKATRELWNDRIFKRINNNLNSINPFGNTDKFDIFVKNLVNSEFDFKTYDIFMGKENYDYRIMAEFDGQENINIKLERNEVNINAKKEKRIINEKEYEFDIGEFWNRDALKVENYKKADYDRTIEYNYNIHDLIKNENEQEIKKIGSFNLDLYFLKSGKSEYSIIKDIKVNKRRELLKVFSGVKLYRDNFKVRPYGENGPMYDWLELGRRAQASPAGVTKKDGAWRVEPYQIIGNINISRINNKNLTDMANRESLALNDTYYLFVEIIQEIISKFEYDRQYIYREYGEWVKNKEEKISKSGRIIKQIVDEKKNLKDKKENMASVDDSNEYTVKEYKEAIYDQYIKRQSESDTKRILMNFSSAGIIASTFSHEISKIATDLGSRNQQLKACIEYILDYKEYDGDPLFNPYTLIDKYSATDEMLSSWVNLIMNGVSKDSFEVEKVNIADFINTFNIKWEKLLKQKYINVELNNLEIANINTSKIDLYLILNNLYLNASWFLEKKKEGERKISIDVKQKNDKIIVDFWNNGPTLDSRYKNNPNQIFEAGETSKEEGTGLGLWICKEAMNRNNGEIFTSVIDSGFKITIVFPIGD